MTFSCYDIPSSWAAEAFRSLAAVTFRRAMLGSAFFRAVAISKHGFVCRVSPPSRTPLSGVLPCRARSAQRPVSTRYAPGFKSTPLGSHAGIDAGI